MPSTKTLQRTVNLSSTFIRNATLTGVGGFTNEPALSIGDWVRQFILAPPFAWRWNRTTATVTTVGGTQDYTSALANFGWMEQASFSASGRIIQLEVALKLAEEVVQNPPVSIAANIDDNSGNITFRFMPVPDKAYTVVVTYQKSSPIFAALTDTWSPIPDYFSYLYDQGFLAKTYEYWNDERFVSTLQLFVRQVIAANAGLTDSQINIFIQERLNFLRTAQGDTQTSQSGRQGRGLF